MKTCEKLQCVGTFESNTRNNHCLPIPFKAQEARLADMREIGGEKGEVDGIQLIAQNMIAKDKSNEDIMDVTDLTLEEVKALRKLE